MPAVPPAAPLSAAASPPDPMWIPPTPLPVWPWVLAVGAVGVLVFMLTFLLLSLILPPLVIAVLPASGGGWVGFVADAVPLVLALLIGDLVLSPGRAAYQQARRARRAVDVPHARAHVAAARSAAWTGLGRAAAILTVLAFCYFCAANDGAVGGTFFNVGMIADSIGLITKAFGTNVLIFMVAEALVLIWGLVVALARMAPGPAGAPVRWLATVYVDAFRALPSIITIYLIGFGLPMTDLPPFTSLSPVMLAVLALTLTYGAYVGEVYKAGLDSIHPSQSAAALSLGLTRMQALRFVILPQAVRRVVPALLNDFISLQKDSALVSVIGVIDAFNQAKIISSNHFNLAPVTGVALLFILITIPQTRLVDRLMAADQRRQRAGG